MPVNDTNVGRDQTLVVQTPQGKLEFPGLTMFDSKPGTVRLQSKLITGEIKQITIPDGHSGSFELDRTDARVDTYFADKEARYFAGQNELPCTIFETIQEANGSISQWKYTGVQLALDESGNWQGNALVKQRISFAASRKLKVV